MYTVYLRYQVPIIPQHGCMIFLRKVHSYKATTQFQRVCTEREGSQLHVMYRKVITLLELWTLERKTINLSKHVTRMRTYTLYIHLSTHLLLFVTVCSFDFNELFYWTFDSKKKEKLRRVLLRLLNKKLSQREASMTGTE